MFTAPGTDRSLPSDSILPAPRVLLDDATHLVATVEALLAGDKAGVRRESGRLRADFAVLSEAASTAVLQRVAGATKAPAVAVAAAPVERAATRPGAQLRRAIFERDGFHCRYCGIPVVPAAVRRRLHTAGPDVFPWGRSDGERHPTLLLLGASLDHVAVRSASGPGEPANLVTSCWLCRYPRGDFSLDDVGVADPRDRPPVITRWDGLSRMSRILASR